jgi:hypothetical protein
LLHSFQLTSQGAYNARHTTGAEQREELCRDTKPSPVPPTVTGCVGAKSVNRGTDFAHARDLKGADRDLTSPRGGIEADSPRHSEVDKGDELRLPRPQDA